MTGPRSLLLVLLLLVGRIPASTQERVFTDDLGTEIRIESPPQRIISMAPNITEILFALELGDRVVGVTRFCNFPPETKEKIKIGGLVDPDLEMIISLNPDLIFGFRGNPIRLLEKIKEFHLPVYALEMGTTIESVFRIIQTVGQLTWSDFKAERLIESLKSRYDKILAPLQDLTNKPRVFFLLYGMGLWTCGQGSFMDDLLNRAGGENIAGNIKKKWFLLNREHLIHENPDHIIILSRSQGDFLKACDWLKEQPYLRNLQAVQTGNIHFLDEDMATRPGPRILEALDQLVRIIHPDLFTDK